MPRPTRVTPARVALAVAVAMLALVAWKVATPVERLTGTNNAGSQGAVLEVRAPGRACVALDVPAGTGRVRVRALAQGSAQATLELAGARAARGAMTATPAFGAFTNLDLPVARRPERPEATPGRLCVAPQDRLVLAGRPGPQPERPPVQVDGRRADARVQVWFLPPAGERASLLSALPEAARRHAVLRPGFVGTWTLWALLAGVALLAALAVAMVVRAVEGRRTPGAPLLAALCAFAAAGAWSLVSPAFNAPDETEYFAYAQTVAEQGRAPDTDSGSRRPPFSSEQRVAIAGAQVAGQIGQREGRPPWLARDERRWERRQAADPARDDGGGATTASPYQPLYFAALAPAYHAGSGWSIWSRLWLMRLTSALLFALGAACVALLVRELVPEPRWPALAAGLLYALHPMVSFMGSVVNNDAAVNAGSALVLWLAVRALRRGLTPRLAVALGAALVLVPVAKGSGLALWVPAGLALAIVAHRRRPWRALGAFAATVVVVAGAWVAVAAGLDRSDPLPTTPARFSAAGESWPTAPGPTLPSPTRAIEDPVAYVSWLWQLFLPPAPGMEDLRPAASSVPGFVAYVERAWGSFGMAAIHFPRWVYLLIAAAMALAGLAALLALRRERPAARRRAAELAVLAVAPLVVALGVEAVFFATEPGGRIVPQFGRYYLPAAPALAVVAVGACFAAGRRRAPAVAAGLVTAMAGLYVASILLAVDGFFA